MNHFRLLTAQQLVVGQVEQGAEDKVWANGSAAHRSRGTNQPTK
jgi:hypothetical protein